MIHTDNTTPLTPQTCILGDLHNFSEVSSKSKNIYFSLCSLCMVTGKVIMNNWIALNTATRKEWITETTELIKLEKMLLNSMRTSQSTVKQGRLLKHT